MNQYNTKYKRGDSVLIVYNNSVKRVVVDAVNIRDTGRTTHHFTVIRTGTPDYTIHAIHITYDFQIKLSDYSSGHSVATYHEDDVFETIEDLIAKFKTIEE